MFSYIPKENTNKNNNKTQKNFYGMKAGKDYFADVDDGFFTQTRRTNERDTIGEDKSDSQQTFEYNTKDIFSKGCRNEHRAPPFSVMASDMGYGVPNCAINTDSSLRIRPLTKPRGPITNPGPLPLPTAPYIGYGVSSLNKGGAKTEYKLWAGDFAPRDKSFLPVTTEFYNLHFDKTPYDTSFLPVNDILMDSRVISQKSFNLKSDF